MMLLNIGLYLLAAVGALVVFHFVAVLIVNRKDIAEQSDKAVVARLILMISFYRTIYPNAPGVYIVLRGSTITATHFNGDKEFLQAVKEGCESRSRD